MVQAQLKQLDQLREVNKRYHTHTVELKDKIAELIVSTHFDVMMHKIIDNLAHIILSINLSINSKFTAEPSNLYNSFVILLPSLAQKIT